MRLLLVVFLLLGSLGCVPFLQGLLGIYSKPWTRAGGTQYEFDSDSAACRNDAGVGIFPRDLAQRRWEDCMIGRGWRQ